MDKKERNEEIQSRREFFKNAAKGALPILGAILLSNVPIIAKAADESATYCDHCNSNCTNGCRTGCKRGCGNACNHSCQGITEKRHPSKDCYTCKYYCAGCSGQCKGSCSGTCNGSSYKVS